MKIDYDKFCHCVLCHKHLITERVVGNHIEKVFTPDKDETIFLLDDGSQMRVTICKKCKDGLTDKEYDKVMKSVIKGWQKEMDMLPHWSKQKKKDYMDRYSKKKILCKTEGLDDEIVKKKYKESKKWA